MGGASTYGLKRVTLDDIAEILLWQEADVLPVIRRVSEPGEWWQIRNNGDGTWTLRSGIERAADKEGEHGRDRDL